MDLFCSDASRIVQVLIYCSGCIVLHRQSGSSNREILLLPTLIPLGGVGTACFSSCCDKDLAIIVTTGRLPDVNPP
jgi:hypothetical protein